MLPDEPISRTDAEAFSEGLKKLRAEILKHLEEETADKKRLKTRVESLEIDIAFLKQALGSMTKRKWGELLVSRFNKWQSRLSLSKMSAGAKVLKFLMPPGETFDVIDSVTQGIDKISDAAD